MKRAHHKKRAQSAIEYLILAATITIVVLIGFDEDKGFLLQARNMSENMFNQAVRGIMGTDARNVARASAIEADYP